MAATASILFFPSTPQTLYLQRSALCTPSSLKLLPKLVTSPSSIASFRHPNSRFIPKYTLSSDLEEDEFLQPNFSPDLKLFVGNLPFRVDSAALADLFGKAGNVEMVEVIYDKITGRSRGFGFVTMSTVEEADAAAQQFNGYELEGRALRVNSGPAPSKKENTSFRGGRGRDRTDFDSAHRLYVGNLSWGVDNLALETLFSGQGKVKEARVVYDRESGRSRGFGFVAFSSADEVAKAIDELDGADLNGRAIRVSPADARPPPRQY